RGIANNPRFAARVAGQSFAAFADLDLADGRFHHLAASLDRARGRLRLYLDGELKAESAFALGAVANAQPVRVGRSNLGHALSGILDELRFSALARSEFAPVLGEGDEAYRRRLAIFERWLLPSPKELLAALNSAVEIAGDPEPLVLVEKDRPLARALATTRLVPGSLPAGTGIDLEGNVRGSVEAACGRPEDEPKLPPELFFRHDDARATYASEAGRRMQAPLVAALEELLARLPVGPDKLAIDAAYDPEGEGLQRVGRALFCHHPTVGAGELAALAHRAGFGWVENRGARVFAAVAAGHRLTVEVVPPAPAEQPPGGDLFTGKLLDLSVGPVGLPAATRPMPATEPGPESI
ncbi:MAG TPA: hypothetical protein PK413_21705, partial [Thermoanaerobaculia bacterium]|nr:hypothetical protein [Thermoanaerobaculia bacterium]